MPKTKPSRRRPESVATISESVTARTDAAGDRSGAANVASSLDAVMLVGADPALTLPPPDSLTEQELLKMLTSLRARAHEEVSKPFTSWEDFDDRWPHIKRACKRGCFDSRLRDAATNLHAFLKRIDSEDPQKKRLPLYWKGRTVLYELNDVFHLDSSINEWTLDEGQLVYDEIQKLRDGEGAGRGRDEVEHKLLKEKALFCAYYVHELKRHTDANTCLVQLRNILDFVNERLKTDETPCFGTRANLCYHLGSLYRRLERHDEAESTYAEAVALYYEHIKSRSPEDHDDELFTNRRVAMCIGLGFGWQNLTRGYLRRAENALAAARSMLAKSLDPVVPSYIELLYGSIRRCRAGKDVVELGEAIKSLELARAAFEEHDHPRYQARACWELALACNQIGELDKADEHLKVIEKHALAQNNLKWQANALIQRSRIYRNRGEYLRSLEAAEKSLEIAEQCNQLLPKVDAQITRGEAFFYLAADTGQKEADYDLAVEDFQTALQMLQKHKSPEINISQTLNPKIASVCVLRMAQCFARIGEEAKANSHFAEWQKVSSTIEHGWVHDLAEEARIEIGNMSEPFYISAKDPTKWDYSKQVRMLRKWLYAQAMKHTKNNWAEAARLIGVERATLYQWRYSSTLRVRRARTTSKKDRGPSE